MPTGKVSVIFRSSFSRVSTVTAIINLLFKQFGQSLSLRDCGLSRKFHNQLGTELVAARLRTVPQILTNGARGGTRTPTLFPASGPKPGASTNFATRAKKQSGRPQRPPPLKSVKVSF